MPVWQLDERLIFPNPADAEPDGLLAIGGDLSIERLLLAYASGIFPWFILDQEVYWFSPDPRCVLFPDALKISKSMQQVLRKNIFRCSADVDFRAVITSCAAVPRREDAGTWIDQHFIDAYCAMHDAGYAHSIEVYAGDFLCGGLYGLRLGNFFFGESMFSTQANASKYALIKLVEFLLRNNITCIDCQVYNDHLGSMGAVNIPRNTYLQMLQKAMPGDTPKDKWKLT